LRSEHAHGGGVYLRRQHLLRTAGQQRHAGAARAQRRGHGRQMDGSRQAGGQQFQHGAQAARQYRCKRLRQSRSKRCNPE